LGHMCPWVVWSTYSFFVEHRLFVQMYRVASRCIL